MNTGNLCISVCAKTSEELFENVRRADPLTDLIEIRFDCLDPSDFEAVIARANENWKSYSQKLLATLRPPEQGGLRPISKDVRDRLWFSGRERPFWGGDFEEDIIEEATSWLWFNRICSVHDFSGDRIDIDAVYKRLSSTSATILKIAIQVNQVIDAIPLWKLLDRAAADDRSIIPIAMGEAGKWTRILGLAHGAFMTYASLEAGAETAPGQISAEDMIDVYRVKQLDRDTEVFGIIAGDTSYTASPWMHNAAFKASGMNRVFIPLQTNDLDELLRRMVDRETREVALNFGGFSITNPHKQAIIEHLDHLDETAAKIGAVNTVKINGGKMSGYNTDALGFIEPLKKHFGDLRGANMAIAGAGGAARACTYALQQEGAQVTLLARDTAKAASLGDEFEVSIEKLEVADRNSKISGFDILVNATPLGTTGENEVKSIATAEQLVGVKLVYDLTYNPAETRLMREAKAVGVPAIGGLEMVVAQGARQFEIWTGEPAPIEAMEHAVRKKLGV